MLTASRWVGPVVGALLAAATVAAVAYATIPGEGNLYTGCMLKNVGTIRLIDPSLPSGNLMSHCTTLETRVSWDQKGQPGAPGPAGKDGNDGQPGPAGPKGDPGVRFRGAWNQFFDYASGDVVQHGGSSWVATESACCGAEPGDSDEWSVLAAAGASGWEMVTKQIVTVAAHGARLERVTCPAGKHALGGGFRGTDGLLHFDTSAPSPAGDAWDVRALSDSNFTSNFDMYVICANV